MAYSLGFDSRLFIGSILRLFYPFFLPADAAYAFVLFSLILLLFMLSCIFGYALRQAERAGRKKGLLALIAFYLLCPGSLPICEPRKTWEDLISLRKVWVRCFILYIIIILIPM